MFGNAPLVRYVARDDGTTLGSNAPDSGVKSDFPTFDRAYCKSIKEILQIPPCEPGIGRLEGWKVGRLEEWKVGRVEGGKKPFFRPSNLPFFHSFTA
jgi:hypothetical protein